MFLFQTLDLSIIFWGFIIITRSHNILVAFLGVLLLELGFTIVLLNLNLEYLAVFFLFIYTSAMTVIILTVLIVLKLNPKVLRALQEKVTSFSGVIFFNSYLGAISLDGLENTHTLLLISNYDFLTKTTWIPTVEALTLVLFDTLAELTLVSMYILLIGLVCFSSYLNVEKFLYFKDTLSNLTKLRTTRILQNVYAEKTKMYSFEHFSQLAVIQKSRGFCP